jgi:23S rRNA (adenine2503-C2)-methyltransferase
MSSVGIIEPMKKFFEKHDQINLAISLHSAKPDLRRKLMPAASQVSLEEIADYIELHINKYNRRVSLEYTLLQNVNDQESDIDALIEFFEQIGKHARKLLHINLIPYNPINDSSYKPSDFDTIKEFQKALSDNNIQVTIRKSLGQENKAACGMLKTANSKE